MEKRTFLFEVQGQYYGAHSTTGVATVKRYVAKFVLPSQEAALSVICKYLLDPYLRKHYDDYAKFRSHRITSVIVNGRLPDRKVLQMAFEDMEIQDLADFCIIKQIYIDPYQHKDLEKCRQEIKWIYEQRIAQKKADQGSGMAAEQAKAAELLAMNELPLENDASGYNENLQKIGAKTGSIKPPVVKSEEPIPPDVPDEGEVPVDAEGDERDAEGLLE